ncbi:nucleoside hydrolase [Arthrobacter sp. zg-Y826]|uniref:nucleoside hydrolase n=1 Tax=Arthrobacter jinronghuae TaxID=2964609 RepID=UPI0021058EFA|nr:nucleoside hydrolase [Arthrobacter jinronghuae]MCQ1957048.1 nucleoside hydrolase [Arthrobacter jinronghuae]
MHSSSSSEQPRRIPVIADVDTGVDDALALTFLARSPRIDLRAVTCVAGNTDVDQVLRNTLDVLDLAGRPDVPVARGAERPLINEPRNAHAFHGANGIGGLQLPAASALASPLAAVELLHRTIEDSPEPVTLLGIGPLTNLAVFLRAYPLTARKLERIVFMGGSAGMGNATSHAEFNAWHDPEALAVVLESGVPVTMYGLDVFMLATLDAPQYLKLEASTDPGAQLVGSLLALGARTRAAGGVLGAEPLPTVSANDGTLEPMTIGDAGAACLIAAPETVVLEDYPVRVELAGHSRGQTLVDRRRIAGEDAVHGLLAPAPVISVAMALDHPAMVRTFLDTVAPDEAIRS